MTFMQASRRNGLGNRFSVIGSRPVCQPFRRPGFPKVFSGSAVVSAAVWCLISELSSTPNNTTMVDIHIQIINAIAAPSQP